MTNASARSRIGPVSVLVAVGIQRRRSVHLAVSKEQRRDNSGAAL
jgi:hypothetical protein